MQHTIAELRQTLQQLEQLLVRFELDIAGRLHAVDHTQAIAALCLEFEQRMRELSGTSAYSTSEIQHTSWSSSRSRSVGHSSGSGSSSSSGEDR